MIYTKSYLPKTLIILLTITLLSGGFSILSSVYGQNKKGKEIENPDNFRRPKFSKVIKPQIPDVNRYQEDKVFLEKADSLFKPFEPYYYSDTVKTEKQVVKGDVVFRQGGMWMYCDSAYYYPQQNSLDAFGHVEMRQGDTLFVYADKLFYDGAKRSAVLVGGPSCRDVKLKDPQAILLTDSLNYDLNIELGWYDSWGRLEDDVNELNSVYGEYSPNTKIAVFKDKVILENKKDNFRMFTEELEYNTSTHIATINTATKIVGENDTILTSAGNYNTVTDNAVLTERSIIIHRDSSRNVITLEGDSIIYDKTKHLSQAFRFKGLDKKSLPMVLTDTARKITLIGGYGEYNDSLKSAFSTEYPLLIEYSRPDSLFLRSDTIATFIRVEMVWPDSLKRELSPETRARLQSYKSLKDVTDDMLITLSNILYGFPVPGHATKLLGFKEDYFLSLSPSSISNGSDKVSDSDKQAETDVLVGQNLDSDLDNEPEGMEKVAEISDSVDGEVDLEEESKGTGRDTLKNIVNRVDKFGRDSIYMMPKEFNVAKAIGKARFFNQDIQGVADTMIYQEYDSILYLIRKPIVWSGERQINGSKINVHFNDSNVDWAHLPENGFMAEYIDEDFYNQLSGKQMKAFFENNDLTHLDVNGNVETIFLPMENDSTYNRMVTAESSFLTIDLTYRQLDKLKMWPEVTGQVIPLFLVKKTQQYLPGFRWYEYLRPKREWYQDRWKWIDELGEVPEDLEKYFMTE